MSQMLRRAHAPGATAPVIGGEFFDNFIRMGRVYAPKCPGMPPVPDFEGEADFEVAGGHLKQLINQTLFAAAKESTRYAFNGVLVVAKGKKISLISTDGRRLAQANGDLASVGKLSKEGARAIIPTKALQLVEK